MSKSDDVSRKLGEMLRNAESIVKDKEALYEKACSQRADAEGRVTETLCALSEARMNVSEIMDQIDREGS